MLGYHRRWPSWDIKGDYAVFAPEPQSKQVPFAITRLGTIMRPLPHERSEAWGVLNPACARGRDEQLYLFPRVVATGNFSSITMCRVRFDAGGDPSGVSRLGVALRPHEQYERSPGGLGGCEDPRITYIPSLDRYIMTYTALSNVGPRIALAVSYDLFHWQRLGLVDMAFEHGIDWNAQADKDALLFPEPIAGPDGKPSFAMIHRPTYALRQVGDAIERVLPDGVEDARESMWISYADFDAVRGDIRVLKTFRHHTVLAHPSADWEHVKIGGGAPPILTHMGWLLLYHGVAAELHTVSSGSSENKHLRYSAGAMILDRDDPRRVLYRSPSPILTPTTDEERHGIVSNVVFPTGLDPRTTPGPGTRVDVYYGMADAAIGAGWLELPHVLPANDSDDSE